MPEKLDPYVLYVSEDYGVAGHMCPCGCGNKVITPLGINEWSFIEHKGKPTLYPSIGNWQLACRSHYWIKNGKIEWSYQWSEEEILEGRRAEEEARILYFENIYSEKKKKFIFLRFVRWLQRIKILR